MRATALLGILLIIGGIAALWSGVSFSTEQMLDLGPLQATIETRERLPVVPVLAGSAIVAGVLLLFSGRKQRS